MRKLLIVLGILLLSYVGLTYVLSSMVLDTPLRSLDESAAIARDQWGLNLDSLTRDYPEAEAVTLRSEVDGIRLRGWYYPADSADCAVVFAHGYHDNRMSMLKYTPSFQRCGCALLLYDHRGFGESDEAYGSGGYHEATDLLTAHAWLRERTGLPDSRIGWLGESWGASTALQAAGRGRTDPAWVIAESPFSDWEAAVTERGIKDYGPALNFFTPGTFAWVGFRDGIDFYAASPVKAAANVNVPVLLIHSKQDTLTAPRQSDLIAEQIRPELLTYHALDWGAWHAHNIIWRREEFEELVGDFLGEGWCEPKP